MFENGTFSTLCGSCTVQLASPQAASISATEACALLEIIIQSSGGYKKIDFVYLKRSFEAVTDVRDAAPSSGASLGVRPLVPLPQSLASQLELESLAPLSAQDLRDINYLFSFQVSDYSSVCVSSCALAFFRETEPSAHRRGRQRAALD